MFSLLFSATVFTIDKPIPLDVLVVQRCPGGIKILVEDMRKVFIADANPMVDNSYCADKLCLSKEDPISTERPSYE